MRPIDADAMMDVLDPQRLANKGFQFAGLRSGHTIRMARLLLIKLLENAPTLKNIILTPCDIGDIIYEVIFTKEGTGTHIRGLICSGIHIAEKVTRWNLEMPCRYLVVKTPEGHSLRLRMDELGKTLFLTREDAEAAMRKGRKDHEE